MGRNFSNRYDSGSVEGSVIKERVLVGGMAVDGVEMGLVSRQEQHIRGFKADGIVGLAFPSISTTQNTSPSQHSTFVQLLQEQFGVVGDLFSVYLTRVHGEGYKAQANGDEEDEAAAIENQRVLEAGGGAGEGEEAQRAIEGAGDEGDEPVIIWTPVNEYRGSLSYWTVQLTGWRTEPSTEAPDGDIDREDAAAAAAEQNNAYSSDEQNGKHTRRGILSGRDLCPRGCQAIVDTGSSLLVPPRSQYQAVMHLITGDRTDCQEYHGMISCSKCTLAEFPDIVISIAVSSEQQPSATPQPTPVSREYGDGDVGAGQKTERQHPVGDGGGGGPNRTYQEFRLKPSDYLSQSWGGCEILVGEGRATDIWTLGDAFIKTYMTIFDVANLRVGFVCADGGRCQGGASPPWRPSTRLCWPFKGGVTEPVESADSRGAYCVYLRFSVVGWALMLASVLFFLVGCLLWVEEDGSSDGRNRGSTLPSPSSQPLERHSVVSDSHFPFLTTGQQERQQLQLHPQLQLQLQVESTGDVASRDGKTGSAHGGGGGRDAGGNSPPLHGLMMGAVGSTVVSNITTPQRRRDGHRKGGGGRAAMFGWLRRWKNLLQSVRVYPKVTSAPQRSPPPTPCASGWAPSKAAHSAADQHRPRQQWPSHSSGGDGRGGNGAGGAGALGTFSSDGMRSRGGTPRPGCSSSLAVGGHHQN
eukprot:g15674.t1